MAKVTRAWKEIIRQAIGARFGTTAPIAGLIGWLVEPTVNPVLTFSVRARRKPPETVPGDGDSHHVQRRGSGQGDGDTQA